MGTEHITMSDEEYYEEEEVTSNTSKKGDGNFLKARQEAKKGELDEQLREYINEWRKQRAKEEEELKRLKEKQAKRKEIRAEQEKKLAQQKKEEEERLRKEEADKKAKEAEEKRKRLEEAEKKRQAMMQAQKEKQQAAGQGSKGPKSTWKKKRKSPSPSASSPSTWTPWMATNSQTKHLSFGTTSCSLIVSSSSAGSDFAALEVRFVAAPAAVVSGSLAALALLEVLLGAVSAGASGSFAGSGS